MESCPQNSKFKVGDLVINPHTGYIAFVVNVALDGWLKLSSISKDGLGSSLEFNPERYTLFCPTELEKIIYGFNT